MVDPLEHIIDKLGSDSTFLKRLPYKKTEIIPIQGDGEDSFRRIAAKKNGVPLKINLGSFDTATERQTFWAYVEDATGIMRYLCSIEGAPTTQATVRGIVANVESCREEFARVGSKSDLAPLAKYYLYKVGVTHSSPTTLSDNAIEQLRRIIKRDQGPSMNAVAGKANETSALKSSHNIMRKTEQRSSLPVRFNLRQNHQDEYHTGSGPIYNTPRSHKSNTDISPFASHFNAPGKSSLSRKSDRESELQDRNTFLDPSRISISNLSDENSTGDPTSLTAQESTKTRSNSFDAHVDSYSQEFEDCNNKIRAEDQYLRTVTAEQIKADAEIEGIRQRLQIRENEVKILQKELKTKTARAHRLDEEKNNAESRRDNVQRLQMDRVSSMPTSLRRFVQALSPAGPESANKRHKTARQEQ